MTASPICFEKSVIITFVILFGVIMLAFVYSILTYIEPDETNHQPVWGFLSTRQWKPSQSQQTPFSRRMPINFTAAILNDYANFLALIEAWRNDNQRVLGHKLWDRSDRFVY